MFSTMIESLPLQILYSRKDRRNNQSDLRKVNVSLIRIKETRDK